VEKRGGVGRETENSQRAHNIESSVPKPSVQKRASHSSNGANVTEK